MKIHSIKLKQSNMLCHRCLLNVVSGLSQLHSIQELDVDLDTKVIKLMYNDKEISKGEIQKIIDDSIINGVKRKI